jgi:hypothetical protein
METFTACLISDLHFMALWIWNDENIEVSAKRRMKTFVAYNIGWIHFIIKSEGSRRMSGGVILCITAGVNRVLHRLPHTFSIRSRQLPRVNRELVGLPTRSRFVSYNCREWIGNSSASRHIRQVLHPHVLAPVLRFMFSKRYCYSNISGSSSFFYALAARYT